MDVSRQLPPFSGSRDSRGDSGRGPHSRGRWARTCLGLFLIGWMGAGSVAQAQTSREYDLKAVLLFNLTRFVEWPNASFADPESPFVIGILGRDPFGKVLDDVVGPESYGKHKILVVRLRDSEAAKACQLLFIGADEGKNIPRILSRLQGRALLTVGDFEEFTSRGGMVALNQGVDGKIRLRINLDAVRSTGLTVSGKLLRVAEIVNQGKN